MAEDFSDLSITPRLIAQEMTRRSIDFRILNKAENFAFFEYVDSSGEKRLLRNVIDDVTTALSAKLADNKMDTRTVALQLGIVCPATEVYRNEAAHDFLRVHGQIVIKPLDSAHGNGVTVGIRTIDALQNAVARALEFSGVVLMQQQITSANDIRLLFIDGEFVAATKRVPASVVGNGKSTLKELIEAENDPEKRSVGYGDRPTMISVKAAETFLGNRYEIEVPAVNEGVQVVGTANIGSGGLAVDMTKLVTDDIVSAARKLIRKLHMNVCGVDFMVDESGKAFLIEINASPSFGLHQYPHIGDPVDVTSVFVDMIMKPRISSV